MPIAQDLRKKPTDVKVRVSTGQGVEITWSDAHTSRYDFPYLRERCPCALCNDEREKKARIGTSPGGSSTPSAVLPMFKPRVTAKSATAVGNYAIQIEFSDSHATGIYSFEHLREICPCEACVREFGPAPKEKLS
ncbi:MAG TPA: gamma-butyrobetaine hydroxylase-like domain-containing protein [Candidatus Acidoferrales bacterium]|jgi:DUF971 family protein|nr:gamma-butyrobetaine hydroxylase-like domain-containing protein [Candidatus Acidoferrales bacterium]